MKKVVIGVIVILLAVVAFQSTREKKAVKIGIISWVEHPALNTVIEGIKQSFKDAGYEEGKNVTFDIQKANGDQATLTSIVQKFSSDDHDILMPIGTTPTQALYSNVKDKPIVFGAVSDPKSAQLVNDPNHPGGNITGTSDVTLYKPSLELLKKIVPNAKKIGVPHNPGEANSVYALGEVKKYATEMGLEVIVAPVNGTAEVYQAAKAIAGKVDAFYELPDNTVLGAGTAVIKASTESKKPYISLAEDEVKIGSTGAVGTNYTMVGVKTGEIALKVINGTKPGDIPVIGVTDADVFLNSTNAKNIGITFSEELTKSAKKIYE